MTTERSTVVREAMRSISALQSEPVAPRHAGHDETVAGYDRTALDRRIEANLPWLGVCEAFRARSGPIEDALRRLVSSPTRLAAEKVLASFEGLRRLARTDSADLLKSLRYRDDELSVREADLAKREAACERRELCAKKTEQLIARTQARLRLVPAIDKLRATVGR